MTRGTLVVALALVLAACGGGGTGDNPISDTPAVEAAAAGTAAGDPAPAGSEAAASESADEPAPPPVRSDLDVQGVMDDLTEAGVCTEWVEAPSLREGVFIRAPLENWVCTQAPDTVPENSPWEPTAYTIAISVDKDEADALGALEELSEEPLAQYLKMINLENGIVIESIPPVLEQVQAVVGGPIQTIEEALG